MSHGAQPTAYPPPEGSPPQGPWPPEQFSQDGSTRRGGFLGFMTSLPGVLTAIAGLVSAATGGVALYLGQDDKPTGDTYIINEAAPVPDEQGQVDLPDLQSEQPEGSGDAFTDAVNGCLSGDAADCDHVLYLLADACYLGDLISCDDLYLISAVGSDYEHYGATCGGRFYDWSYDGACSAATL